MNFTIFVLNALVLLIMLGGVYSLVKETVFTEFTEFFIERNSTVGSIFQLLNHSLITFITAKALFTGTALILIGIYSVLSLVIIGAYAYAFYNKKV